MSRKAAAGAIFATFCAVEVTFVTGFVLGGTFGQAFALTKTQVGICLGAMSIGMSVMSPLAGGASHRLGPVSMLVGGLLGMMAGTALVMVAAGFASLLAALSLIGLSSAFVINATCTVLAELYPEKVQRVMSLASALWFGAAAVAAPAIGAWLKLSAGLGAAPSVYRVPFALDFAALAACLVLVRSRVPHAVAECAPPGADAPSGSAPAPAPGRREWLWIPALAACHGVMVISLRAWSTEMAVAKFGANDFQASLMLAMISLGMGLGRLVLGFVDIHQDERTLLAWSSLAGGAVIALGLAAPTYGLSLAAMTVGGFISAPTFPCLLGLVGTRFAASKARVYGYMEASVGMAGLLGPATVGALADAGMSYWQALAVSPISAGLFGLGSIAWRLQSRDAHDGRQHKEQDR